MCQLIDKFRYGNRADRHFQNTGLNLHEAFSPFLDGNVTRHTHDADNIAASIAQRHARDHEPAISPAAHGAFFITEIRLAAFHDLLFDFGNASSDRSFTMNFEVGQSDQISDVR